MSPLIYIEFFKILHMEMKDFLLKLLSFETIVSKPKELEKVIDFIDTFFNDYEVHTRRYEKNGKHSLVVTNTFTKSPQIFFNGHVDVVPGNYPRAFDPYQEGTKIYGRGASDMKGPVVGMIYAFVDLVKQGCDKEIGLMITTDEEQGGFDGVEYLLNEEGYSCECAFVPDTGKKKWEICIGEKAVWFLEIEADGVSVHSSRLWEGNNAIENVYKVYQKIKKFFINKYGEATATSYWVPTVNLGKIEGGEAFNKVPDKAKAGLDIRFPAELGFDNIAEIVGKIVRENGGKIVSEPLRAYGMYTDENNFYLKKWREVYSNHFKKDSVVYKAPGSSDARFFGAKGIPVVMCKSKCSDIHTKDEWCDIEDLQNFRKLIVDWINSL